MSKKILTIILVLAFSLLLPACVNNATDENSSNNPRTNQQGDLPEATQILMGTVLLDETDYAVDSEQAAALLPLWKAMNSLSNSDTAAQVELDAVLKQIQNTMTDNQISEIDSMGLTFEDMGKVFEILGVDMGFGRGFGEMNQEMQSTVEAMRESGGGPPEGFEGGQGPGGGMFPGGGPGFGRNTSESDEVRETAMAERGGGFGINSQLYEALIAFLEAKIQ
jgi:hypothetical protein